MCTWHVDTGYICAQGDNGGRLTMWDPDGRFRFIGSGTLVGQAILATSDLPQSAPDQVEPSAPWLIENLAADEWWERVRPN